MLVTITYILSAAFGGIPFVWWGVLMASITDFLVVHSIMDAMFGDSENALSADDLAEDNE